MSDNPFKIIGGNEAPAHGGKVLTDIDKNIDLSEQIKGIITSDSLVLFMKGTPDMPMCGFSANSIAILNNLGAKYTTFNILEDMEIREGLKQYANWPTYPQLYIKGELVGGNDIITEMFHSGDLEQMLKEL
jgi:monothiol glutaredoxin